MNQTDRLPCIVPDCGRLRMQRRRYCGSCYGRLRRYGDPMHRPGPRIVADLSGRRIGTLTVEHYDRVARSWLCLCECGKRRLLRTEHLNRPGHHSCGDKRHRRKAIVGYIAAHERVHSDRGRAAEHPCAAIACGNMAAQWAYDHSDPDELSDAHHGPFSLDVGRYRPLCHSCHTSADHARQLHLGGLQLPLWTANDQS
ncbi:hypothetical protein MP11Mi_16120 [Gordonia sp. MP11Mi]|uniref:Uncharacterized protein n=1 Tax=Gordonia sp. MP11Mi TaxID=3022769 RepID=A0AA97CUA0_9ACTN